MNDILYGSLISMAERVRGGEISPIELVDAHLQRIERLNPKLNAFVNVDAERARARAKAAEAAMSAPGGKNALGSLHGVPDSELHAQNEQSMGKEARIFVRRTRAGNNAFVLGVRGTGD